MAKKIILITGANSGIGFVTTRCLASASPDNHIIMGVRSLTKGQEALDEIKTGNPVGTISLLELDVTSDASIESAVQKLTSDYGVLDVLINNAGISGSRQGKPTRSYMHTLFDTNVFGPMLLTEALEPLLQKSQDPRIVNVSSNMGSVGLRADHAQWVNNVPVNDYRASKAAFNMVSATQRWNYREWPCPAKVFTFCPGYVATNIEGQGNQASMIARGAKSPETSAQGILEILNGERDGEVHKFITVDNGAWPW